MIQQDPVFKSIEFLYKRLEVARQQRVETLQLNKEKIENIQLEKIVKGLDLLIHEIEYQIGHIKSYKDSY